MMTREEAAGLVKALFREQGTDSPGLNDKGFGGIMLPEADIYFEHEAGTGRLIGRAHLSSMDEGWTPEELTALRGEEKVSPTGGGRFEHMAENQGLYLSRVYEARPEEPAFVSQIKELAQAALRWRQEVVPEVLERVHAGKAAR